MTKRFEKAYNALVKGFMEETLAKGTCAACAVGNIVADAQGGKIVMLFDRTWEDVDAICSTYNHIWASLFLTTKTGQRISIKDHPKTAEEIYILTGYSAEELAKIEYAFETNTSIPIEKYYHLTKEDILEDQFKGLCAVVDVMLELDGIKPEGHYKEEFRKHPKLKVHG